MTGVYRDKAAGHWRVRINTDGEKQKHVGTTDDKTVAYAMYDMFVHLNGLVDSIPLNYRKMDLLELYEFIEERDLKALEQVMRKTKFKLTRNDDQKPGSES